MVHSKLNSLHMLLLSLSFIFAQALAQTVTPSSSPDAASDGSGLAPYRSSPSFLLFVIQSITIGLFLLVFGKRGWRVCCGLGGALTLMLVSWVAIVNALPAKGFGNFSREKTDIITWVITAVSGCIGAMVASFGPAWRMGMALLGGCGGLALALSIVMMADDCLPDVARWILIGVLTFAGLFFGPWLQATIGMAAVTSIAGSFLLLLGIDLLVNETRGMSLGLRYLFDNNSGHSAELLTYHPPVTTRVFLVLIWTLAIVATVFQTWFYRDAPFVRTFKALFNFDDRHLSQRALNYDAELEEAPVMVEGSDSHDTLASRINRRYQQAVDSEKGVHSKEPSPQTYRSGTFFNALHPTELSSPDTPPSRPNSFLSTNFGNALASRPPTFFDEPLNRSLETPPPLPIPPPPPAHIDPRASHPLTQSFAGTFEIPVQGVRLSAFDASAPSATDVGGLPFSTTPPNVSKEQVVTKRSSSSSSKESSAGSRRSWRKPVPPIEVDDTASTIDAGAAINRNFDSGLLSGRDASLAPTGSTPSSGDISTILPAAFGSPRVSKGSPTPINTGVPSSADLRHGSQLALAHSPSVEHTNPHASWSAYVNNPPSTVESSAAAQSFITASDDEHDNNSDENDNDSLPESLRHTPELSRNDTPSEGTASLRSPGALSRLTTPVGTQKRQGGLSLSEDQHVRL